MLGLAGAHGTGKTTLAEAFSELSGLPFIKGTTRATYERLGLDPQRNYPLDVRLDVQFEILKDYEALYAQHQRFVTDRTPLDMMAYLLADVQREGVTEAQGTRIAKYLEECYTVLNRRFPVVLIVQPGIPFVAEEGRPLPNVAYQEHIHVLVHGFAADERFKGTHFFVPRAYTDMDRRLEACAYAVRRSGEKHSTYIQSMKEAGTPIVVH
jgi:hypothetical protein